MTMLRLQGLSFNGLRSKGIGFLVVGCVLGMLGLINLAQGEMVGERFRKQMEKMAAMCEAQRLSPTDSRCILPKVKPADPFSTEEGRFAHSIKIPNPLAAESGYKPSMTPEQYFDHLCNTEAGEFIYKMEGNVEGIIQLRPRLKSNYEYSHLYAFEDPFGFDADPAFFVSPGRYAYYEAISSSSMDQVLKYTRYFGYDGRNLETIQKASEGQRKSRYGYTWRGIVRPHDRENGIGGGEVIVLDLERNEVLAVIRGYARFKMDEKMGPLRAGWRNRCPTIQATGGPYGHFILKVLKPRGTSPLLEGVHNVTK